LGAFREGLATFGWAEGRNLRIDYRFAGGDTSRLAADAQELANLRPDVIFAYTGPAARAVQPRTSVIPIVFAGGGDPTSGGLVLNIARPEGNMTGFANIFGSLGGRWLRSARAGSEPGGFVRRTPPMAKCFHRVASVRKSRPRESVAST
jgi:putative tryptophan/tyrosine transport system substrate-binding protein